MGFTRIDRKVILMQLGYQFNSYDGSGDGLRRAPAGPTALEEHMEVRLEEPLKEERGGVVLTVGVGRRWRPDG
jgi:hypothetical protein